LPGIRLQTVGNGGQRWAAGAGAVAVAAFPMAA
jgi:hypothetical protein